MFYNLKETQSSVKKDFNLELEHLTCYLGRWERTRDVTEYYTENAPLNYKQYKLARQQTSIHFLSFQEQNDSPNCKVAHLKQVIIVLSQCKKSRNSVPPSIESNIEQIKSTFSL